MGDMGRCSAAGSFLFKFDSVVSNVVLVGHLVANI